MKFLSSKAFTLIEVIVSIIIIGIVSAFSWMAVSVLNPTSEANANLIKAENLITKSQEQVYQAVQTRYDTVENCTFLPGNTCGFDDITVLFPGFTRTLQFVPQGTSELKGARVTVTWQESGYNRILDSLILLARPRVQVPGNLKGRVSHSVSGQSIDGVTITINKIGTNGVATSEMATASSSNAPGVNYNFAAPVTGSSAPGRFLLNAGQWRLAAAKTGFIPYVFPDDITIPSNEEAIVNFQMMPLPENGFINVRLVNPDNSNSPVTFNSNSQVNLYEGGIVREGLTGNDHFRFTISFQNINPRSFTVATNNAFLSRFAGNFPCTYPRHALGWSSSVVREDGNIICGNSWTGASSLDRLTVNPGQTIDVSIPLVPVPTATLQGVVSNQSGTPIEGASIYVNWHNGMTWQNAPQGISGPGGVYTVTVPAEQSMFANDPNNYYLKAYAEFTGPSVNCCNQSGISTRSSGQLNIGPIHSGEVVNRNFTINISTQSQACGNAHGNIINDRSGAGILNAPVEMFSDIELTMGDGSYLFNCDEAAYYRLPVGATNIRVPLTNGYYQYFSLGNLYYNPRPPFIISANVDSVVPTIGLWPRGFGTVRVTLRNSETDDLIPNTSVRLYLLGNNNFQTGLTNASGVFEFSHVEETWPPPGVVNNPNYKQTVRRHHVVVPESAIYESHVGGDFTLDNDQIKEIEIDLIPKGGV